MPGDLFLYVGSVCGACFYIIELQSLRETYAKLFIIESKKDNKILNYYSIRLRLCSIVNNFSMVGYNFTNNLESAATAFFAYLCVDFIFLSVRLYYAYTLQYKIKDAVILNINVNVENPIHNV